jgi:hypothetical protein
MEGNTLNRCNVNETDGKKNTKLHLAVEQGSVDAPQKWKTQNVDAPQKKIAAKNGTLDVATNDEVKAAVSAVYQCCQPPTS